MKRRKMGVEMKKMYLSISFVSCIDCLFQMVSDGREKGKVHNFRRKEIDVDFVCIRPGYSTFLHIGGGEEGFRRMLHHRGIHETENRIKEMR